MSSASPIPGTKRKLRDSCTPCANAKTKCSKIKPTCSRCQERGLACSYAPSHRYGRLPASAKPRLAPGADMHASLPRSSGSSRPHALPTPPATYGTPTDGMDPTGPMHSPLIGTPGSLHGFADDASLLDFDFTNFSDSDIDITGMLAPGMPAHSPFGDLAPLPVGPDGTYYDYFPTPTSNPSEYALQDMGSYTDFDLELDVDATYGTATPASTRPTSTTHTPLLDGSAHGFEGATHSCLGRASGLLSSLNLRQPGQEPAHRRSASSAALETLEENRAALKQAEELLSCPCAAADERLLLMVALVASSVVARYAGLLRGATRAAQGVLGDLHLVLALIDRLSSRRRSLWTEGADMSGMLEMEGDGSGGLLPPVVLEQMEEDLSVRLRKLTDQTLSLLRHA
ncbi:hypothetical protein GQ53DRAFT_845894 [Thozetella sp. PMI_491]|nr:hypothetical protein GQ53DRAFT_845894 [Thozetella sp. PMI_491]